MVGALAQNIHMRPSEIAEFHGSTYEKLMFDAECIAAVRDSMPNLSSTRGRMMARRMREWPSDMLS